MAFKRGTEVEVTSDDDGFRGVWYIAKIIQAPKKQDEGFAVVEYNELVSEEDETKKLSERVNVSLVRPLAPTGDVNDVVEMNHVVDVFHKDGWWVGVVKKIVASDEFLVAFDDPPDSMVVKRADIRLHFDWVNGDWVKPDKKIKIRDSNRLAMLSDHPGNSNRQNESARKQQPEKSCAATEKDTGMNDEIVEEVCNAEEVDMFVEELNGVSAKKCETPPKKHQKSKTMDQEMHTVNDFGRPAMLSGYSRRPKARAKKQQAGKSGASTEKKTTGVHDEIVENGDAEKVDMSVEEVKGVSAKICETTLKKVQQNKTMDQEMHTVDDSCRLDMLSNQSGSSARRSIRVKKQQAEKGSVSTEKKDNTGVHVDIVERCVKEVVKKALSAKDCETSPKKDQKKQSTDQELTTLDSTNGSTQGDVSSKRKRGKQTGKASRDKRFLRKTMRKDLCVGNEAEINAESDCLMQTPVDIKSNENHVQPSSNDSLKVTADKKQTSGVRQTAIISLPEDQTGKTVPSKRVGRFKNSLSNVREGISKLVDKCRNASPGNASSPEIYHVEDVDMLMVGNLGDVNDDQVRNSSMQVDKPSPTGSDSSRTLPVQGQCANANGRHNYFGTPPVAKKDIIDYADGPKFSSAPGDLPVKNLNQTDKNGELGTPASVGIDNMENGQSLPFIKCSPLWKAIESMDIYKRMAQKPHFSPLVKCSKETREGLAIAHMVNFSNLVEITTKLQFSDPITVIESSLETLAELESNGFDVEKIRACLTQLLSKKQNREELQKEYQDIENEISNICNEKDKIDEEICQLNQKKNDIATKLGNAVSRKEMKEQVVLTLKSKQDVVSQNVQGLQLDFQNIAGSLC
ncbi:hypothetical protein POM88_025828 [Heracleum sosnowskyi]|uniref:Agenet domain-containing protein n=1 Tax=Heracleum sosnowskyi TaxID=360622 RepID=A0AAD8MNI2_9APIA|nr:hypothetical protein POM88_025828 [Heracleum sosnowskyi]